MSSKCKECEALRGDRDHADMSFRRAIGLAEANAKIIDDLRAEMARRSEYLKRLEDDYSRQGQALRQLKEEIAKIKAKI